MAHTIGYILASDPAELDYDFGGLLPEGLVMVGAAPLNPIREVTLETVAAVEEGLDGIVDELVARGVDGVIVSIAPLIYVKGVGYDRELIERIRRRAGVPATTNQTAAMDALRTLGVRTVLLLSPNTKALLEQQTQFFEDSGVAVGAARCLDILDNREIDCVLPETSLPFIRESLAGAPPVEGVYLSGSCWRTVGLIEPLEREFGLPVVTALQAMVWAGMRMVGDERAIPGHGRLMRLRVAPPG